MTKPVIYALLAMMLYATQNVVLEQKLSKYHTIALLVYFYGVLLPVSAIVLMTLKITGQNPAMPSGNGIIIAILAGLIYFFADYFFIGAYTNGGDLLTITSIVVMFPVFASIVKYFWVGGLPNTYQVAGYFLAVLSVVFVNKGSSN